MSKLTISEIGDGGYNLRKPLSPIDVGFEPTNMKILLPERSCLDHSNMLLSIKFSTLKFSINFQSSEFFLFCMFQNLLVL